VYTGHVPEYELVTPRKITSEGAFLSHDVTYHHGASHRWVTLDTLLTNYIPMSSTFLVSLTFNAHVSAAYVTTGTKYVLYNTHLHFKGNSLLNNRHLTHL
ncbi:unnamed protein product, partial [Timema podura]|nr:unnamed protein product [Timema podura]